MTTPTQPARLDQPLYGASFGAAFLRFWKKYATFSGRASRSEYWWAALAEVIILVVLGALAVVGRAGVEDSSGQMVGATPLGITMAFIFSVFLLASIVPNIALSVRRLHDANFSGGFYFLTFIPSFGSLILFVFSLLPSNPQGARFDRAA